MFSRWLRTTLQNIIFKIETRLELEHETGKRVVTGEHFLPPVPLKKNQGKFQ